MEVKEPRAPEGATARQIAIWAALDELEAFVRGGFSKSAGQVRPAVAKTAETKVEGKTEAKVASAVETKADGAVSFPLESPVYARLSKLCETLGITSAKFHRAPKDYYGRSLAARRAILGAPSTSYLCKSMVMHNTKCEHKEFKDPTDSKYFLIVFQYTRKLHNEKLIKFVHTDIAKGKFSKKKYNFRLADVSAELTGYDHNAVTPLGSKNALPIVLSHHIAELGKDNGETFFWLGGGEEDLKFRISIADFMRVFKPFVADITGDEILPDDSGADEGAGAGAKESNS